MRDMTPTELLVAGLGLGIMLGALATRYIDNELAFVIPVGALLIILAGTGVLRNLGGSTDTR